LITLPTIASQSNSRSPDNFADNQQSNFDNTSDSDNSDSGGIDSVLNIDHSYIALGTEEIYAWIANLRAQLIDNSESEITRTNHELVASTHFALNFATRLLDQAHRTGDDLNYTVDTALELIRLASLVIHQLYHPVPQPSSSNTQNSV
jgi:hypothetical protein